VLHHRFPLAGLIAYRVERLPRSMDGGRPSLGYELAFKRRALARDASEE